MLSHSRIGVTVAPRRGLVLWGVCDSFSPTNEVPNFLHRCKRYTQVPSVDFVVRFRRTLCIRGSQVPSIPFVVGLATVRKVFIYGCLRIRSCLRRRYFISYKPCCADRFDFACGVLRRRLLRFEFITLYVVVALAPCRPVILASGPRHSDSQSLM